MDPKYGTSVCIQNFKEKTQRGKIIRRIWGGNIKKDFNRIGCEGVEWTK
jgi:hypothetical protein